MELGQQGDRKPAGTGTVLTERRSRWLEGRAQWTSVGSRRLEEAGALRKQQDTLSPWDTKGSLDASGQGCLEPHVTVDGSFNTTASAACHLPSK